MIKLNIRDLLESANERYCSDHKNVLCIFLM